MEETLIGIKMADHSFYPIMEDGYRGKKRLVLTTVRDNQNTVRIDLYKSRNKIIDSANYVGSLIIENIEAAAGGEPEIEVILGIDQHNNLNAIARNRGTDARQRLHASLENLEEQSSTDLIDFKLEDEYQAHAPAEDTARDGQGRRASVSGINNIPVKEKHSGTYQGTKKGSTVGRLIFVAAGLLLILGLTVLMAWFINHYTDQSSSRIEEYLSINTSPPSDHLSGWMK